MKVLCSLVMLLFSVSSFSQVAKTLAQTPDPAKKLMTVTATCGECNLGMPGQDCDLAVRIKGVNYFVDGVGIMEYGHPHKPGGFCVAVRKAEVQGDIVDGRFKATYFKLLDEKGKDK